MKCPYCKQEMETGLIQSNHELAWLPGNKRKFFAHADFHKGSIMLSKLNIISGSAVEGFVCRDCGKLIIDFGDPKSDLNHSRF